MWEISETWMSTSISPTCSGEIMITPLVICIIILHALNFIHLYSKGCSFRVTRVNGSSTIIIMSVQTQLVQIYKNIVLSKVGESAN